MALTAFPLSLLVGAGLGFLSGLGVGGGSLLLLWLTQVAGTAQSTAQSINLLFFLPAALGASVMQGKKGSVRWDLWLRAVIPATVTAWVCRRLSVGLDTVLLKKLFGGLLILMGLREILGKRKDTR